MPESSDTHIYNYTTSISSGQALHAISTFYGYYSVLAKTYQAFRA